ncbi:MAG: hypothetical protein ACOCV2_02305 [Persicimonas sp.]
MNDDDLKRAQEAHLKALREAREEDAPATITLPLNPPEGFSQFKEAIREADAELTDGLGVPDCYVQRAGNFSVGSVGPSIREMMAQNTERRLQDYLAALMVTSAISFAVAVAVKELKGWPAVCGAVCYAAIEKAHDHLSVQALILRRDLEFLRGGPPSPGQTPDEPADE